MKIEENDEQLVEGVNVFGDMSNGKATSMDDNDIYMTLGRGSIETRVRDSRLEMTTNLNLEKDEVDTPYSLDKFSKRRVFKMSSGQPGLLTPEETNMRQNLSMATHIDPPDRSRELVG